MALVDTSTKREPNVLDHFGDALLNAFTKVKVPDQKFVEIKDEISKFEQNLVGIEKMHSKIHKAQQDLGLTMLNLGGSIESLGRMETQITEPLAQFGNQMQEYSKYLSTKNSREDMEYVGALEETISYCQAAKETLKLRDQKQVDHEELMRFLEQSNHERDKTLSGRHNGIGGFFQDKINDFKGVDPERTRQERLSKLDTKIHDVKNSNIVASGSITK
jgi:sorting nexin-4